jgi:hypothetical protein
MRTVGIPLHIELRLATMLGIRSEIVGLILHLLIGGGMGVFYAYVMEFMFEQGGVLPGLYIGALNAMVAGFIWSLFDGPGRFWSSYGPPGVIALLIVHMMFGAIVGGVYKTQHNYVPNFGAGS